MFLIEDPLMVCERNLTPFFMDVQMTHSEVNPDFVDPKNWVFNMFSDIFEYQYHFLFLLLSVKVIF